MSDEQNETAEEKVLARIEELEAESLRLTMALETEKGRRFRAEQGSAIAE